MSEKIRQDDLLLGEEYTEIIRAHKQLLFFISSARVRGVGLLRVTYGHSLEEEMRKKITRTFKRVLSGMKKREEIAFFVSGGDLFGESTEARYLLAKCPWLTEELAENKAADFYIYL